MPQVFANSRAHSKTAATAKASLEILRSIAAIAALIGGDLLSASASAPQESKPRGTKPQPQHAFITSDFKPERSAGIFIGIQRFRDKSMSEISFAADDAIDLAYAFSKKLQLIPSQNVLIVIVGVAKNPESRDHLEELKKSGVIVLDGEGEILRSDIIEYIGDYASIAKIDGTLVVSISTHGYDIDGHQYLAMWDSTSKALRETGVSTTYIIDKVSESSASRSLLFIDACNNELTATRSPASYRGRQLSKHFIDAISPTAGDAIFLAARPGGYAFDDEERRNGVFTGAVLDGLNCQALEKGHDMVTATSLAEFVDSMVLKWKNRRFPLAEDRRIAGIETAFFNGAGRIPIVECSDRGVNRATEEAIGIVIKEKLRLIESSTNIHDVLPHIDTIINLLRDANATAHARDAYHVMLLMNILLHDSESELSRSDVYLRLGQLANILGYDREAEKSFRIAITEGRRSGWCKNWISAYLELVGFHLSRKQWSEVIFWGREVVDDKRCSDVSIQRMVVRSVVHAYIEMGDREAASSLCADYSAIQVDICESMTYK